MKAEIINLARNAVRRSSLLMSISYKSRGIRRLKSLSELDIFLDDALRGSPEPTSEALATMMNAYLEVPNGFRFDIDPRSPEYALRQRELYGHIAGKTYRTENESTSFDFETVKHDFFPYNTRSAQFVGNQLLSQGFIIKNLPVKQGASIVEFGAGWGNLTLHLAMMGYRMTAVELNKQYLDLMAHRAALHGKSINLVERDMLGFAVENRDTFDAALFVASFHHVDDHVKMIELLSAMIAPDGHMIFADEPIVPAIYPAMPYPWGLRMDAATLYYVRRHGWLELGFQLGYFKRLLLDLGWNCQTVPFPMQGSGDLQIATRIR